MEISLAVWLICILSCVVIIQFMINRNKQQKIDVLNIKVKTYEDKKNGICAQKLEVDKFVEHAKQQAEEIVANAQQRADLLKENVNHWAKAKHAELDVQQEIIEQFKSNLTAIPYAAAIISDFDTRELEILAQKLDWGYSQERLKKVLSIREIRKEAQALIAQSMEAKYQLSYAIKMFPALEDFLETDYAQVAQLNLSDLDAESHDRVRNYVSKEEYQQLSSIERNQLALDRYWQSHRRSNWQIGRDYEMYVGYQYTKRGYDVEYYGSLHGLEDLGRDLIARQRDETLVIQCKYWSAQKTIHEKHINQLYGTMICYCFENEVPVEKVQGILVTNITTSDTAKRFANYLGIQIVERNAMERYPCIKCNINRDQYGRPTKIYHLPFDQQYDACKIDSPGEFFAMTVAEAENAGFRRAHRWYGG